MQVNGNVGKESKADFVTWSHHDGVIPIRIIGSGRCAPNQIRALYGRSRRASANYTAACQESLNFGLHGGSKIGVRQPPLTTAFYPNAGRLSQRFNEFFGICPFAVPGMKDCNVSNAEVLRKPFRDSVLVDL